MNIQNTFAALFVEDPIARRYVLRTMGMEIEVDARDKGRPGDTVVLWPKKRCPVVVRRLGQVAPYPGEAAYHLGSALASDRFFFTDPETGHTFDMEFKKLAAIHKVIGGLN